MEKKHLSQSQLKSIQFILESASLQEAARKAKISRSTLYVWMKDQTFRQILQEHRTTLFREALDLLKQGTGKAVIELIKLLDSPDATNRRLAAKEILSLSLKVNETFVLEERILRIENALERNEKKKLRRRY